MLVVNALGRNHKELQVRMMSQKRSIMLSVSTGCCWSPTQSFTTSLSKITEHNCLQVNSTRKQLRNICQNNNVATRFPNVV